VEYVAEPRQQGNDIHVN